MRQTLPASWLTIHFKEYPRFDKILLPKLHIYSRLTLATAIRKRVSTRSFTDKPIRLHEFAKLLYYSCGITRRNSNLDLTRRSYPSAGARYPLEVYLINFETSDIKAGLFHYNVKKHSLETLILGNFRSIIRSAIVDADLALAAKAFLIITAIPSRTTVKYQSLGEKFTHIEAGHLAQNTYLISQTLGMGCCAIGGCDEVKVSKLLDIDPSYEKILYLVALGRIR